LRVLVFSPIGGKRDLDEGDVMIRGTQVQTL